jgi:hypothetical protein
MENQPIEGIEMVFSKPLAMSAMKRDILAKEIEKPGEEVQVGVEGLVETVGEKEIK